ncbi:MAG: DUF1868 domain-containing protein [Stigonema ocellatum SAG 48.90 = DSM 106950]|nr:DUF1868 domain-containing protein [Stigonema ocellatum SAG 48.90 = DSM 106950]
MDDNYQTYLNRVARMTLPEAYKSQIQHIQESSKFCLTSDGKRRAMPFPGYAVMTPPSEEKESENFAFYTNLQGYQQELLQLPLDHDLIVPVPPASFHLTLADLIWESAYLDICDKNPAFEQQLHSSFTEIFEQYQQSMTDTTRPICWQMLGLIVMPRSVGVCLVPQDKDCYEQIVNLRRAIFQNPKLMALGIEQNYHFTAHVTLGYFGEVAPDLDRDRFSTMLADLNQQWLLSPPEFVIRRAELRKFDDMTHYYRQPDWPIVELGMGS